MLNQTTVQSESTATSEWLRFRAIDQASCSLVSGFILILLLAGGLPPLALICFAVVPLTLGVLSRRSAIKSGYKTAGRTRAFAGLILGGLMLAAGLADSVAEPRPGCRVFVVLNQATSLETSVNSFVTDYGYLPGNKERIKTAGPDGILFLRVLLGLERADHPLNSRGVKYLIAKEGKIDRGGLIYTKTGDEITGMFDPWGNPYVVLLDTDNDGKLAFRWGDRQVELKSRHAAVFTPGPDHKEGTADDVRTW